MKISEIITDKYKLRIEPNVYYDLLADVREAEEEQEPICPSAGVDCEDCPAYEPKVLNKWIGAEVLDRIRNEMHATAEKHEDGVYYLRDEWIDEIIDKYAEEGKA